MDSGTIIIAILFILICSIPFVIMGRNSKKREKQFLRTLLEIAGKNNGKLSNHDFLTHAAIGIDDDAKMIFFVKKANNMETHQLVTLHEIQKCNMITATRNGSNEDGLFKIIEKLELAFEHRDKRKANTVLEFYNADYSSPTLTGELQLIEKWCKMINDKIAASASQVKMIA